MDESDNLRRSNVTARELLVVSIIYLPVVFFLKEFGILRLLVANLGKTRTSSQAPSSGLGS